MGVVGIGCQAGLSPDVQGGLESLARWSFSPVDNFH